MGLRLRGFAGFIDLADITQSWVNENPSFSVYQGILQMGRFTCEEGKVHIEVFEENCFDLLDAIAEDILTTYPIVNN